LSQALIISIIPQSNLHQLRHQKKNVSHKKITSETPLGTTVRGSTDLPLNAFAKKYIRNFYSYVKPNKRSAPRMRNCTL